MSTRSNYYRWLILGLVWFSVFTFATLFQSIPPILGLLVSAFQISYAQAGGLMSLFMLPAVLLSIPSGLLVDRHGPRLVGSISLLTMALGTMISALGSSYLVLGLGRLVTGIGAVFTIVNEIKCAYTSSTLRVSQVCSCIILLVGCSAVREYIISFCNLFARPGSMTHLCVHGSIRNHLYYLSNIGLLLSEKE